MDYCEKTCSKPKGSQTAVYINTGTIKTQNLDCWAYSQIFALADMGWDQWSAFLTSPQVKWILLVWGPNFENHCSKPVTSMVEMISWAIASYSRFKTCYIFTFKFCFKNSCLHVRFKMKTITWAGDNVDKMNYLESTLLCYP